MNDDDRYWLRRAIELAAEGSRRGDGGPFGAVIVRGHVAIGEGWNRVLSRPDPTAHAEIEALRAAAQTLGEYHLVGAVAYASSEPCPMCWAAFQWARVDRIVFAAGREVAAEIGFDDARLYEELASPDDPVPTIEQALEDEAAAVMRAWAAAPGSRIY